MQVLPGVQGDAVGHMQGIGWEQGKGGIYHGSQVFRAQTHPLLHRPRKEVNTIYCFLLSFLKQKVCCHQA